MRLLLTGDCHKIVVKLVFREVRKKKKKPGELRRRWCPLVR